jgi:two-component system phosphate regulon response regulator OmpR
MNAANRYSTERIGEPHTLLVVDDDPMFRELTSQMLCGEGYMVLKAEDADGALQLASTAHVALLLANFWAPEADPLKLGRQFRALHPETPVLMVSDSVPMMHRRTENLERFAILAKPFTFNELVHEVRTLLDSVAPLAGEKNQTEMATMSKDVALRVRNKIAVGAEVW